MTLTDLAHAVLNGVIGHWPLGDPDLPDLLELPARRYVTIGTSPIQDCEQLVVSVERTFGTEGNPALERIVNITSGVPWLRTAVITVQIIRCISTVDAGPGGTPIIPRADVMDSEGSVVLADADATLRALIESHNAGELGGCGEIALENWRALGDQGGFHGGTSRLRLNLF